MKTSFELDLKSKTYCISKSYRRFNEKEISLNEIAKDEVPMPKVVINPKTKELQKPKEIDPLKICESIVYLASNPNIRESYGNNLYKTVKQKFNIENYYEILEHIYKNFEEE